jgi:hypothetical protein
LLHLTGEAPRPDFARVATVSFKLDLCCGWSSSKLFRLNITIALSTIEFRPIPIVKVRIGGAKSSIVLDKQLPIKLPGSIYLYPRDQPKAEWQKSESLGKILAIEPKKIFR